MKLLEVEGARAPVPHIAGDATGHINGEIHNERQYGLARNVLQRQQY